MRNMALYLTVLLILWWPAIMFAVDDDPPEPVKAPGPPPPGLPLPIDTGLLFLLISGLLLGGFYLLKFRRKLN